MMLHWAARSSLMIENKWFSAVRRRHHGGAAISETEIIAAVDCSAMTCEIERQRIEGLLRKCALECRNYLGQFR